MADCDTPVQHRVEADCCVRVLLENVTGVLPLLQVETEKKNGGEEEREDEYEHDSSDEEVRSIYLLRRNVSVLHHLLVL